MDIRQAIKTKRLYFDGGMGTLLQKSGLNPGEKPENWNITHSDVITNIHLEYLRAGTNILTTNSFGANSLKFDNLEEIIPAAINNAKKAIELLGGKIEKIEEISLSEDMTRTFVVIKKIKNTPPKYPRQGAKISKNPIV